MWWGNAAVVLMMVRLEWKVQNLMVSCPVGSVMSTGSLND